MNNRNGAQVLDNARAFVQRFCVMPSDASLDLLVLFAAHSHAVDGNDRLIFDTSPRMMLSSEGPGSGKSRALELLCELSHNARMVTDPTAPSFAQLTSELRATVLIDEMDVLLGKGAAKADLRGSLNASYKRKTAFWSRANKPPVPIFAAVAFAGMGETFRSAPVLAALRSRTIVITMVPGQPPEDYRPRIHDQVSGALRDDLTEWVGKNTARIMNEMPDMPEGITGRLRELAEPLIQVAACAGGRWPEAANNAVRELLLQESDAPDALTLTDRLLRDLRQVFADRAAMGSVDLTEALAALPGAGWDKMLGPAVSAPKELAGLLEPLGASPDRVRIDDHQVRGYTRASLEALWTDADDGLTVQA